MRNYVQRGEVVTIPSPREILSGEPVVFGELAGVADIDADAGEDLDVVMVGVFDLRKVEADAFIVGDPVFLDTATGLVTAADASGVNPRFGTAMTAAPNPSASVHVRLG